MKKKERMKLKEFMKTDEWQKMTYPEKRKFTLDFIRDNDFKRKDKKELVRLLLGITV